MIVEYMHIVSHDLFLQLHNGVHCYKMMRRDDMQGNYPMPESESECHLCGGLCLIQFPEKISTYHCVDCIVGPKVLSTCHSGPLCHGRRQCQCHDAERDIHASKKQMRVFCAADYSENILIKGFEEA
jgi:hypothetical protein